MKFSYPLLKKLVPGIPSKRACIDALTMHAFETEDISKHTLDISITPNRYADAASHWGIARELTAIFNTPSTIKQTRMIHLPQGRMIHARIQNPKACPRYAAYYFTIEKQGTTPRWMKDVLIACGIRPRSLIVDITNYVMLETGQPLHAFNASMVADKTIIVRNAHRGESIQTIDGNKYHLTPDDLLITDKEKPLALAGIKGGMGSEISAHTKEIILEAANFDPITTHKTAQRIKLSTDASVRFAHGLSPELVGDGLERATQLIMQLAGGKLVDTKDIYPRRQGKRILSFDIERHNGLIGQTVSKKDAISILGRLGFRAASSGKNSLRIDMPPLRLDIKRQEDISEEIVRIQGYENVESTAPTITIQQSETDETIRLEEKIRRALITFGYDEIYTHSFISKQNGEQSNETRNLVELENPVSEQFWFLRPSLKQSMVNAVSENAKHETVFRLFEIGAVFTRKTTELIESRRVGIVIYSADSHTPIEVKGVFEELFRRVGLVSFFFREEAGNLRIESDHSVLGTITTKQMNKPYVVSYGEIDIDKLLRLVKEEVEYAPLPRFPSAMRDISIMLSQEKRIGDIIADIQKLDLAHIADVDLIDIYEGSSIGDEQKSVTLRIVFRAEDRTLTDGEIDKEMQEIIALLGERYDAEIR